MTTAVEVPAYRGAALAPRLIEGGRVLGFVLAVGAVLWIAAAIAVDRDLSPTAPIDMKTLSGSMWSVALTLLLLGVWAPSLARPNLLSFVGSALAFAGGTLLAVLVLRNAATTPFPNNDTLGAISVALIGAGIVVIGVSITFVGQRSLVLGAIVFVAGLGWGIYGIVDYGSDAERYVSIAPAIALLLAALTMMWPPLLRLGALGRTPAAAAGQSSS